MRVPMRRMLALICTMTAIAVSIPLLMVFDSPASAQSGIALTPSVQMSFPSSMTFSIKAQSDVNITQLRLHYKVERQNYADVTSEAWAQFTPGTTVNTQWLWDMRKGGIPPGTLVNYWWTAIDASGKTGMTPTAQVNFADNRYKWQSITSGPITLYWYQGSNSFANSLIAAGQQALQRLQTDTGAIPQRHASIYIYASTSDLQGALLFPQEWTGGVAFTGYDVIAIGVSTSQLTWGQGAVRHELTHWITHQLTFNNYGAGLPVWLEEGLATYGEGPLTPGRVSLLSQAVQSNNLISVRSLSSPFSAITSVAELSYTESYSIVNFLIQTYGKDKMVALLDVFGQGNDYDQALRQVYGFDQDGLNSLWRQSLGAKTASMPRTEPALAGVATRNS